MNKKPAFVLGNGKSRLAVDLPKLHQHGVIYGCNRLYQDHPPDVLVATDKGIADEIQKTGYAHDHEFWTRYPLAASGAHKLTEHWQFSSGPCALVLACRAGHSEIFLFGMDLMGTGPQEAQHLRKFNNVYAGTDFYRKPDAPETYYGNWVNQIEIILKEWPAVTVYRVAAPHGWQPPQWEKLPNFKSLSLEEFWDHINTT